MATTVSLDHNIDDVVSDIDSVKRDLRKVNRAVRRVMDTVAEDARAYVRADADYTGQLRRAIGVETETQGRGEHQVSVATDATTAPYAAIVEFGSGVRTDVTQGGSVNAPPPEQMPPGTPYETPDINYDESNPLNMKGYPTFYGFVKHIEEWMENKPVEPLLGDTTTSAAFIARAIIEKGQYAHPFLRPAWFQNELRVQQAARNAVRKAVR
jgi:HK97 gp10 family phage protein